MIIYLEEIGTADQLQAEDWVFSRQRYWGETGRSYTAISAVAVRSMRA